MRTVKIAVVVSVGAGYYGYRLHRMSRADWDRSIQDNLVTHFNTQRVFIEQLRRQRPLRALRIPGAAPTKFALTT